MELILLNFLRPLWLFLLLAAAGVPAPASAGPGAATQGGNAVAGKAPAVVARPNPAIWLLADADTKIYLLGTVHVLRPGFAWRSPLLDRIILEADELVEETYEEPGSDINADARAAMFLEKPSPILERVPKGKQAALKAAILESRIPLSFYDRMRTWTASIMLGLAELLGGYGVDNPDDAPGVEDVLEQVFRSAGKPISSVEDPQTVVEALNALPAEVQTALLLETIAHRDKAGAGKAADDRGDLLWARGDVDRLGAAIMKDLPPALLDPLVRRRNRAWTGWLESRLERPGTLLFAVGAGHLAGPDSVQRMLAERGLTAQRIN
jgi:uncharacterized protein YbaP (TraB family)